jgi:hypothetical protein
MYSAITWINIVLYIGDPAGTVALNREWYEVVNIPLVRSYSPSAANTLIGLYSQGAVIAAYVQSYYCYRL